MECCSPEKDTTAAIGRRGGTGFIGFRFNNGAGVQYGWARIRMHIGVGHSGGFALLDYAYADPGEPIRAGQTSRAEQAPEQGSLGWLALGAAGLLVCRKSPSRTPRGPTIWMGTGQNVGAPGKRFQSGILRLCRPR
jgi:hypothetical protein